MTFHVMSFLSLVIKNENVRLHNSVLMIEVHPVCKVHN